MSKIKDFSKIISDLNKLNNCFKKLIDIEKELKNYGFSISIDRDESYQTLFINSDAKS